MNGERLNNTLKITTAVTTVFLAAAALLYLTLQHVAFLQTQANAANQQTAALNTQAAALNTLSKISEERLEINRQLYLNQVKILQGIERIEKRQEQAKSDGESCSPN